MKMTTLQVHRISAEQFVGALTGENDLHVFRRVFREEIQRHLRGVRQRLVHEILDLARHIEILLCRYFVGNVFHVDLLGKRLRVRQLAVLLFLISDREGLDR